MDPHTHPMTRPTISEHLDAREAERRRWRRAPVVELIGLGFALAGLGLAGIMAIVGAR